MTFEQEAAHASVQDSIIGPHSPSSNLEVPLPSSQASTLPHLHLSCSLAKISCRLGRMSLLSLKELGLPPKALGVWLNTKFQSSTTSLATTMASTTTPRRCPSMVVQWTFGSHQFFTNNILVFYRAFINPCCVSFY